MPTSTGTALAPPPAHRKSVARVALFNLSETSAQLLMECFRQFGIETVSITREDADRLRREKFEACVLPLEETAGAVIKLVRSTRMLVLHEFRRYVRIPVMTEVGIVTSDGGRIIATSQEISSGGMSLKGGNLPEQGSLVEVSFSLLTLPRVWVRGHVTWRKPNKSFGIRFDATDERRHRLKEWIVAYLET